MGIPFGANILDLPADVAGVLSHAHDVDCYAFRAPNGEAGVVNVSAVSESVNLIGELYGTSGGHTETVDAWFSEEIEHRMLLGPTSVGRLCIQTDEDHGGHYRLEIK
jgi:hypothetical protein